MTRSGAPPGEGTWLTLLGTGGGPLAAGPRYVSGRSGNASLISTAGRHYLVDAGHGTVRRLGQVGVAVDGLSAVFVTHLHSDHIADLFAMFLLSNPGGTMDEYVGPVPVFGPGGSSTLPPAYGGRSIPVIDESDPAPGIGEFFEHQLRAFRYDVNVRNIEQSPTAVAYPTLYDLHEIALPARCGASPAETAPRMAPFSVFEDDRVRVTTTLVAHPPVFPAFGFRFETADGSVTFSGDTAESQNLVELAAGTDVLVHEVVDPDYYARTSGSASVDAFMRAAHTMPEAVGRVADEAGAGSVVLSHLLPGDPTVVSDETWCERVGTTYAGEVVAGHDLMRFAVGTSRTV